MVPRYLVIILYHQPTLCPRNGMQLEYLPAVHPGTSDSTICINTLGTKDLRIKEGGDRVPTQN